MVDVLKYAHIFKIAASAEMHQWAADIVNKAFQQEMGRNPTPAERQIVMAVSSLESGYGKGWGKGSSTGGQGSHNWGAVQTRDKSTPGFMHGDSSAEGKYTMKFKAYPNDVAGAADVVRLLFKSDRKQREPNPERENRALGPVISGPGRGELIQQAAQQGDTLAFSKAMWYTGYFEGVGDSFTKRISDHARGIQSRINEIASALGESPAWNIRSQNFLPVTNNPNVVNRVSKLTGRTPQAPKTPTNVRPQTPQPKMPPQSAPADNIESMLWF